MRAEHWDRVAEVAARQDGLVTSAQAMASGTSRASFRRELQFGRLVRVRHRVYRVAGQAVSPLHEVRAVALAAPSVVASHQTAAALWRLMSAPTPLHFTISPPGRAKLARVTLHRSPVDDDRTAVDGIPCTSPARTIVDLATVLSPVWVERLLHDAVMRGLCQYDQVSEVERRRRSQTVRSMLDGGVGSTPLEFRWYRLLRDAGVPEPVQQHQVVVDGSVYVLDFAWPEERVALEVDGFVAHRTRAAFDRDRAKVVALKSAGWEVVAVSAKTRPEPVVSLLCRLLDTSRTNS